LDGKLTSTFRDEIHIDGSFLAKATDYLPHDRRRNVLFLDWKSDPVMQSKGGLAFVEALSPDGIWGLVEQGKAYAGVAEEQGVFEGLRQKNRGAS
jgi:prepilin-type processing-associated H-X9-DG protein